MTWHARGSAKVRTSLGLTFDMSHPPRFESTREMLLENLAQHGLSFREWTTVAGGESNDARVDQILTFVTASDVGSWAVVDDEDVCLFFFSCVCVL